MRIFIDSADTNEIDQHYSTGLIDGVTTNPTLIMKSGRQPKDVYKHLVTIGLHDISMEVVGDYNKMLSDARDSKGDYEYLTSLEGNFQMTHMTEENSHNKVFRNEAIYCAQFEDPVTISEIWKIDPKVYMKKMKKRRPWPKDTQNNFTITLDWVKKVGTKVYPSA